MSCAFQPNYICVCAQINVNYSHKTYIKHPSCFKNTTGYKMTRSPGNHPLPSERENRHSSWHLKRKEICRVYPLTCIEWVRLLYSKNLCCKVQEDNLVSHCTVVEKEASKEETTILDLWFAMSNVLLLHQGCTYASDTIPGEALKSNDCCRNNCS